MICKEHIHHKKLIVINGKKVDVDEQIIPLVKFTNRFPGVKTRFSCQGDKKIKGDRYLPYIGFRCNDLKSLRNIKMLLKDFSLSYKINYVTLDCQTDFKKGKEFISYSYSFPSYKVMKKFITYTKNNK